MTGRKTDDENGARPIETTDPSTGRGSTSDPHQADLNDVDPWSASDTHAPETSDETEVDPPAPDEVPGTTKDPNQADRT